MTSFQPLVINNGEVIIMPDFKNDENSTATAAQPIKVIYHQSSSGQQHLSPNNNQFMGASGTTILGSVNDVRFVGGRPINRRHQSNFNQYLATFTANLASTAAACTMTWTSPTLEKLKSGQGPVTISKDEGDWLGSLLPLGAVFGPIITGLVVNHLGKKWTIIANMLILLFCWLIIALADEVALMYAARFITGIAVGSVFNVVPLYVSEISSPQMRGRLGSYFLFFLCIGFLISYIVGPYTSFMTLIGASASIAVLCIVTFIWVPESPHFLLQTDKKEDASKAIEWLRNRPDKSVIQLEVSEIQAAIDRARREERSTGSVIELMAKQGNAKSLYYACSLVFYQQMVGYNAIVFYSEEIFKMTGSAFSPQVSTIIIGFAMFVTSCIVPYASKLIKIKYLMRISAIGCGVSLITLGTFTLSKNTAEKNGGTEALLLLPVVSLIFFIISHCIGLGSYSWVIIAEIFPPHLKSFCSAFTTSFCWFLCFIVTKFFSKYSELIGMSASFYSFVIVCVVALFFCIFQLPDTQGRSFQEIQDLIHGTEEKTEKCKRRLFSL